MSARNFAYIPIALATIYTLQGALAANTTTTTNPAIANYERPISFEPNRGQTDKQVDFLAHGTGYSLFLSHAEAVMVLKGGAAVRLKPVRANASSAPTSIDEQSSKSNYFIGNVPDRWHTGIPNYAKVRYANVYPGIDLIYYGNQHQLEYDFIVKPGADPSTIELQFDGPAKAALERSGELVMHTKAGDLRWHKPVAYQEIGGARKLVACAYVRRDGDQVGIATVAYDHARPLIIDPELVYSTYLGGTGIYSVTGIVDEANGIAVDRERNAYVTGSTTSADFPTKNAFQDTYRGSSYGTLYGGSNVFMAKFNAAGQLVYSTYLGGSGSLNQFGQPIGDSGSAIALDHHGNAYVTGSTASPDFPIKNAFQESLKAKGGDPNAFVAKLDATGSALVYSTYLGGSSEGFEAGDFGNGIAVDAEENAYVTGSTTSTDFPTKNAFQKQTSAGLNAFVTKLCPAGNALVYSTLLGGNDYSVGYAIAVDRIGQTYVTGTTRSTDFPTKNAFQAHNNSQCDIFTCPIAFVTKFDSAGTALVYSTYLGGSISSFGDSGYGIAVDERGQAYITGYTTDTDFPTKNAFQSELKGDCSTGFCNSNAFVTKFNAAGTALVYSTYLGGLGNSFYGDGDAGAGIATDSEGNAYVTGSTFSSDFPIKDAFQNTLNSTTNNAFVTKFCPIGTLVYSTYLGGSGHPGGYGDAGNGIAVDAIGSVYLAGVTRSADFPTKDAFQATLKGETNAFVTKISAK